MQDGMMMAGPMMMVLMLIVALLVLAALATGIVWIVRTVSDDRSSGTSKALETLELRYARGEIERDEYVQRRDDLERRS